MDKLYSFLGLDNKPKNSFEYENKKSKRFNISEISKQRINPRLDEYIDSLHSASNKRMQSRVLLYDHYLTTLMTDDIVSSLLEKRLENITNKNIQAFKDNKSIDELNYFFESTKFTEFLKDIVLCKFWGFQLFEFDKIDYDNKDWFDYRLIPHKHINPYKQQVLEYQFDREGESYENKDDVLFIGNKDDLGLFSKVTLLSLYNRLGMFGYSKYLDLASENFQTIKSKGYDDDIEMIQDQLTNRGSGGVLKVPSGVDYDIINQSSTQQNQLFENYLSSIKDRMSTLILGQTMTTQDGSSRSQAEVHQSEQNKKYSSDELFVLNVLNFEFRDYLKIWFPDIETNNITFKFIPSNIDEMNDKINYYQKLKELGVQFEDYELREVFKEIL